MRSPSDGDLKIKEKSFVISYKWAGRWEPFCNKENDNSIHSNPKTPNYHFPTNQIVQLRQKKLISSFYLMIGYIYRYSIKRI